MGKAWRLGSFKRVAKVNRGQSDLGSDVRHGEWLSHPVATKTQRMLSFDDFRLSLILNHHSRIRVTGRDREPRFF